MTVKEAAELIGVARSRVQALIQAGIIQATVINDPRGIVYDVDRASAEAYKNSPRKAGWAKGRPRGKRGASTVAPVDANAGKGISSHNQQ